MPILLIKDISSLKIKTPVNDTTIRFNTVKMMIALDKSSNLSEYTQIKVPIEYSMKPSM